MIDDIQSSISLEEVYAMVAGGRCMMDKRNTTKGKSIRLFLDGEVKRWLFERSEEEGKTVSSIVEELVLAAMETEK